MRLKKETISVKYLGVYLLCEGYFEPGEDMTYDYPGSAPEFDIHKVIVDSTDIMDLLDEQQLEELEHLCLDSM